MMRVCSVLVVLVAALIGGICSYVQQTPQVLAYRVSTSGAALYALMTMPQAKVDAFLKSFELFEKEQYSGPEDGQTIVDYYTVINHLCALGDVEKMYIPPVMDLSLGIFGNQLLWEEKGMADKLDVGPGKKVLDVGCGRGRVAHHVASHTGAHVTGINIDPGQIGMGKAYAEQTGMLGKNLDFVQGNYNDPLPFADDTFDALYHVQALSYAQDLKALLKEMNRVLKPGAKISFLDWFKLPAYDPTNATHQFLLRETKAVIGAVKTPSNEEYMQALKETGFEVIFSGEASVDGGHQWPLVMQADVFYTSVKAIVDKLTDFGVIPAHFKVLLERLVAGGQSFVTADKLGLFTTSWQIIAQKPHKKR